MPSYDTVVVALIMFKSFSDPGTISVGLIVIFCCSLLFVLMTTLIQQFLDFYIFFFVKGQKISKGNFDVIISPKIGTKVF